MKKLGITWALVALAALFWWLIFGLQIINFWWGMALAAPCLAGLALLCGGPGMARQEWNIRALTLGATSALLLYAMFWLGNILAAWLFAFAPDQVQSIYGLSSQGRPLAVALILLFVTSPAEEIFWRGFVQRRFTERWGGLYGWLAGAGVYAAVHIASGNFMLVMAALVAGLFWGLLYWKSRNLPACIISHSLWTASIFVFAPVA